MQNYAGHRLSPWLGHLMVSRSETARPLLTPGEVMQLPPADEIVMVAGTPPIRAKKARYFEDRRFQERVLPPPALAKPAAGKPDDWSDAAVAVAAAARCQPPQQDGTGDDDPTGSERRQQPELTAAKPVEKKAPIDNEFELDGADDADDDAARAGRLNQRRCRASRGRSRSIPTTAWSSEVAMTKIRRSSDSRSISIRTS